MFVELIDVPMKIVDQVPSVAPTFGAAFRCDFPRPYVINDNSISYRCYYIPVCRLL